MAKAPVRIEGMEGLEQAFAEISSAAMKGVLRRAIVKAARPIAQAMSDFAPIESGTLSGSPKIEGDVVGGIAGRRAYAEVMRAGGTDPESQAALRAAAQRALRAANKANPRQYRASADIGPARYARHAHLVEFGTGPRHHKNGKFVGVMPPDPFVRPAWDVEGGAAAQQRIATELRVELDKAITRARARAAKKAAQ